jgi:hypothetical protein
MAISNAISAAAAGGTTNGLSGGTVEFPAGVYMSGPLNLKSSVNLQLDSAAILRMLPFGQYPVTWFTNITNGYYYFTANNFVSGANLHDIAITGTGGIEGQGTNWWPWANTNNAVRPIMIRLNSCNRELIQGVTLSNSPMFHISLSGSAGNSTVQGVTILANPSSDAFSGHNTDACDVAGTNILVQNCKISVGDDNFTCGGNTWDVLITNNTYGYGHGVSIGSYTSPTVSNITVVNCTFNNTEQGIRIKSDYGRGGLVQNISYYNLSMTNVHFPILIYGYYNEIGTPSKVTPYYAATQAVASVTSTTPIYRNITISNLTATAASGYPAGLIWARMEAPATNIVLNKINITASKPFEIYSASQLQLIDAKVFPPANSNTFLLYNSGVVVSNSAPSSTTVTFDGLTTNGYGSAISLYNANGALQNTNLFDDGPLTIAGSTFTVSNSLTLSPSTVLNYTLGTSAATLAVRGNLTLGGTNNIFAGPGFTNGTYTLMTYNGTLSGNVPGLGAAPEGFNYSFDTNTVGQVRLVVSNSLTPPPPPPPTNSTVFADGFTNSTLNSSTLLPPTAGSTSYEMISSKNWSPSPGISAGHLTFGIGGTTSGSIEVQALFTNLPVSLINPGDSVSLAVTFVNTSGLLTQSSSLGFGLYHSGQTYPVPGGLNGSATTNATGNATGNAQTWSGYVGQLSYSGGSSRIMSRALQTGGANNNQDVVTSGSGSASYSNPVAATVGSTSSSSLILAAGAQYTELLTITLSGANTLAITNSLYSGPNTNGSSMVQFGGVASGTNFLTSSFDAMAIGWRATANTSATAIDINQISVNSFPANVAIPPSLTPPSLAFNVVTNGLQVSWPQDHIGWTLLSQTNVAGLGTSWVAVPGSAATNNYLMPMTLPNGSVFLRLVYTNQ